MPNLRDQLIGLGWEWDDERGGYKPTPQDSGRFSVTGGELVELFPLEDSEEQPSTPPTPLPTPSKTAAVKVATPDIVRAAREVPVDQAMITTILLNDVGGQELISISRSDLINGQNVSYQPISDAKKTYLDYNPTNIIYLPQTLDKTLDGFPIKLNSKIPTSAGNNVLFSDNKLIVRLKDIQPDELIEIQVVSSGTLLDDTIYTGE